MTNGRSMKIWLAEGSIYGKLAHTTIVTILLQKPLRFPGIPESEWRHLEVGGKLSILGITQP